MTIVKERTVKVLDKPHTVTVYRKSKSVWIAVGEYAGEQIEVKGRSEGSAVGLWVDAARYRGNL
jgi:hypothetical protein